jgi:hypothetical protein
MTVCKNRERHSFVSALAAVIVEPETPVNVMIVWT